MKDLRKDADEIFDYWNMLESPIPRHEKLKIDDDGICRETKTYSKAVSLILINLKLYTKEQIAEAMDRYHIMLLNPDEFIIHPKIVGHRVRIDQFFMFSRSDYDLMGEKNPAKKIPSWFSECIQGWDYLNQKYKRKAPFNKPAASRFDNQPLVIIDDPDPNATARLKTLWKERGWANSRPQDENSFRRGVAGLKEYITKNRRKIYGYGGGEHPDVTWSIVHFLIEAIEMDIGDNENDIAITPGWLCSETMFNKRLPNYFKEHGMMDE